MTYTELLTLQTRISQCSRNIRRRRWQLFAAVMYAVYTLSLYTYWCLRTIANLHDSVHLGALLLLGGMAAFGLCMMAWYAGDAVLYRLRRDLQERHCLEQQLQTGYPNAK